MYAIRSYYEYLKGAQRGDENLIKCSEFTLSGDGERGQQHGDDHRDGAEKVGNDPPEVVEVGVVEETALDAQRKL